jgi:hypothetical protein
MSAVSRGAGVAAVIAMFAHTTGTVERLEKHVGKDVRSVATAVLDRRK